MAKKEKLNIEKPFKMNDMSKGHDFKAGYKGQKAKLNGLNGKPASINSDNVYVCESGDEKDYYEARGYKAKMKNE